MYQGQLVLQTKTHDTKITNISMWTDAFLIFASIFCSIHKSRLQELLKYMQVIRLGATRGSGLGWKVYDEQFRLRKSHDPASSWAIIDTELWLLHMQPTGLGFQQEAPVAPRQMQNQTWLKCYAFNYNGSCLQQHCLYKHSCLRCSEAHPAISCTIYRQGVNNNAQLPFRYFRPNRVRSVQIAQPGQFAQRQLQYNPRFRSPGTNMGQRPNAN